MNLSFCRLSLALFCCALAVGCSRKQDSSSGIHTLSGGAADAGVLSGKGLLPPTQAVVDFSMVDQGGLPFTKKDLKGKVWVADFVFTRCTGPCPGMTKKMKQLQDAFAKDADFHLVSFSVDPSYDTAKVLTSYAKQYGADLKKWTFLTGKLADTLAVETAMHLGHGDTPMQHSTYFVLVDRDGKIRNYYGDDPEKFEQLQKDIRKLLDSKGP